MKEVEKNSTLKLEKQEGLLYNVDIPLLIGKMNYSNS